MMMRPEPEELRLDATTSFSVVIRAPRAIRLPFISPPWPRPSVMVPPMTLFSNPRVPESAILCVSLPCIMREAFSVARLMAPSMRF
ncbi:hypothetical protein D3C85_1561520 [compost metagenome]